jgi:hypothetical protein
MKATVEHAVRVAQAPARIDEVDISTDAGLEARYALDIPVLLVDGKKAAKHRVTADAVLKILRARAGAG